MNKVQLTLTNQETIALNNYGAQFGYNLSKTIKYLISKTVEEFIQRSELSVFSMSQKTEDEGLKALAEHKKGQSILIKDIDKYFDQL
jgi:hypothetical protein